MLPREATPNSALKSTFQEVKQFFLHNELQATKYHIFVKLSILSKHPNN